eukprot:6761170-Pyramimonas_sp.AAC.1
MRPHGIRLSSGLKDPLILTRRVRSFGSSNDHCPPGIGGHRIHGTSSTSHFVGYQGDTDGYEDQESDRDDAFPVDHHGEVSPYFAR